MRFLLLLLGLLGLLLCLGGIAGAFWVKGTVVGAVDSGHDAVDGVLDGAQQGIAEALPRIRGARQHLAAQAAEKVLPELGHLRARLESVARAGDSAAGVLEALGADGVKLAELRAGLGELRAAARNLVDRPEKREPALQAAEKFLGEIHADLTELRLGAADLRNRMDRLVGLASLVLAGFFAWMGLGQLCMVMGGRPRDGDAR